MSNEQRIDNLLARRKQLEIDLGYYQRTCKSIEGSIRAIDSRIAELSQPQGEP